MDGKLPRLGAGIADIRHADTGILQPWLRNGLSASSPRRDWDAIRFSVARASQEQVTICFVCELAHAPVEHGKLMFDLASEAWLNAHPDPRVLRLATCYLQTYRARQSAVVV